MVFIFHSRIKGTESIIRFGSAFQLQPADLCKLFVNLALAKYLSRVETNFTPPPLAADRCRHCARAGDA